MVAEVAKRRKAFEDEVAKLEADCNIEIERCRVEMERRRTDAESHCNEAVKAVEVETRPQFQVLTAQMAEARTMIEQHARAARTREFISSQTEEASAADKKAQQLTAILDKLDVLKQSLASALPVPGLELTADGLTLDGVPFQRVNKAKQIQVAVSIAKLQAGELGLIVIDDLEHLDSESFAAFRDAAEASGLQFVAARVADSELEVTNV